MGIFSLNSTLIAELVLFAIVAVVIAKVVLPPLRRAMNERQAAIRKGLADAEAAEGRLAQAEAEYERRLNAAKQEGRVILDTYRAMGETIIQEAEQRPDSGRRPILT